MTHIVSNLKTNNIFSRVFSFMANRITKYIVSYKGNFFMSYSIFHNKTELFSN